VDVGVAFLAKRIGAGKVTFLVAALAFGLAMRMSQRVSRLLMLIDIKMMGLKTILMMAAHAALLQIWSVIKLPLVRILMTLTTAILLTPRESRFEFSA
jgi:hypothetical protein